jgi:twitching motility protein PilT
MLVKRANGEGRMAALEVMLQTVGISNLIRENKCYQIDAYLQTADPGSGMQSLDTCLFQYVREGLISVEEGLRVANFPDVLRRLTAELPEDE